MCRYIDNACIYLYELFFIVKSITVNSYTKYHGIIQKRHDLVTDRKRTYAFEIGVK